MINPPSKENSGCICCGHSLSESRRLSPLLVCTNCGHICANLHLSDDEMYALYSDSYFQGAEYLDYEHEAPALRRNFRRHVRRLARLHPDRGRLWEVGSAYGYFLLEAQAHFEVAGCDIAQSGVAHAKEVLGLNVQYGDYLDIETAPPYDVVCLWDTIEHLRTPHQYLKKASDELRRGGTLALSTGDVGSPLALLRGRNWRLIHPPTHLHYFTKRSMTVLLERLGFAKIRFNYYASWRTADAVAYLTLAHSRGRNTFPIYALLKKLHVLDFSFPINTFDLMTVHAEKQ